MNIITFLQQQLCQVRTILACDTRDKGYFLLFHLFLLFKISVFKNTVHIYNAAKVRLFMQIIKI